MTVEEKKFHRSFRGLLLSVYVLRGQPDSYTSNRILPGRQEAASVKLHLKQTNSMAGVKNSQTKPKLGTLKY